MYYLLQCRLQIMFISGEPPSQPAVEDGSMLQKKRKREDHSYLEPASTLGMCNYHTGIPT